MFFPPIIKGLQCARGGIWKWQNVFKFDSCEWARCSVLIMMCCVYASVPPSPSHLALHHHQQCSYSMCNTEMSASSYKGVWYREHAVKKAFYLKTIYSAAGKRHTDLKLCVDRPRSIPTACPYISSMCWNGKYAIDLCALVLYSNISNEWQNKRGTVCHARGEVQHKEDS